MKTKLTVANRNIYCLCGFGGIIFSKPLMEYGVRNKVIDFIFRKL